MTGETKEQEKHSCEEYGASPGGGNTAIWVAVLIGAIILIGIVVGGGAYFFRGQQTGSQLTDAGEAQANQYKDMNLPGGLKNLVMPGNSNLNMTNSAS